MTFVRLVLLVAVAIGVPPCSAFHHQHIASSRRSCSSPPRILAATDDDASDAEKKPFDTRVMQMFMEQKYPAFMQLLSDQEIWKELSTGQGGYTVFAPNNKAFDKLGENKLRQLNDPRNLETTEKIGRYHAIAAPVTSKQIYDGKTGGIKTLGVSSPHTMTSCLYFLARLLSSECMMSMYDLGQFHQPFYR